MRILFAATAVILGLSGTAWAQEGKKDGERERERKKPVSIGLKDIDTNGDGRAQVSELLAAIRKLSGNKEGEDRKRGEEGSIALASVDTDNDGKATLAELQAALAKAREGGERKEEGKKKRD